MNMWNCKYCLKTINLNQKELHQATARHKFKARWVKYHNLYNEMIKELDSDHKLLNYSFEEYEARESDIIKELDELLTAGIFDDQPDDLEIV